MTRDYSRREFVAGCGCAGAGALLAGNAVADSGGSRRLDPPPQRWDRSYEGAGDATTNAVVGAVDDNGFVFAGARAGEENDRVAWLYKVDPTGELVWEQTYSQRSTTVANDLVATEDGYALGGVTNGSDGGQDGFAVRVGPDGAAKWSETFWLNQDTDETVTSLVQRPDNGFVCAGRTSRFDNAWVQRLGSDGAINQSFTYDGGDGSQFNGVVNHPDGGFFLAGSGKDTSEDLKGWIMHIDDGGQQQWSTSQFYRRESGDVLDPYNDFNAFYDVVASRSGFFLVGATGAESDGDDRKGWVMEVNNTGVRQSETTVSSDRFTELSGITSGELTHYAVGQTATSADGAESKGVVARIDLVGEVSWTATYSRNTASRFEAAALGDDGGVVLAGNTASSESGDTDGWSVKLGGPEIATPTPTPSPTATPQPTTTAPVGGPPTTTTDTDEGSGPPLAMLGVAGVIVALGAGGFLYNRFFRGDDDGDGDGTIAGPGPATGGSAPLTDDDTDGADAPGEDADGLTPASEVDADEEVTGAQTVVEKPDTDEPADGESPGGEPTNTEPSGGESTDTEPSDEEPADTEPSDEEPTDAESPDEDSPTDESATDEMNWGGTAESDATGEGAASVSESGGAGEDTEPDRTSDATGAESVDEPEDTESVDEPEETESVDEGSGAETTENTADAEPTEDSADAEPAEDSADAEPAEEPVDTASTEESADTDDVDEED